MTVNHDVVGSSPTAGVLRDDQKIISIFLHLKIEFYVNKKLNYKKNIDKSMTFF